VQPLLTRAEKPILRLSVWTRPNYLFKCLYEHTSTTTTSIQ